MKQKCSNASYSSVLNIEIRRCVDYAVQNLLEKEFVSKDERTECIYCLEQQPQTILQTEGYVTLNNMERFNGFRFYIELHGCKFVWFSYYCPRLRSVITSINVKRRFEQFDGSYPRTGTFSAGEMCSDSKC